MVGKILGPTVRTWEHATAAFDRGFCDVYPRYAPTNGCYANKLPWQGPGSAPPNPDIAEVKEYQDRVRHGLYHLAYTKRGLIIHDDDVKTVEDFAVFVESGPTDPLNAMNVYYVNLHKFNRTIINYFNVFVVRLRDRANTTLRGQFEFFFDTLHTPQDQLQARMDCVSCLAGYSSDEADYPNHGGQSLAARSATRTPMCSSHSPARRTPGRAVVRHGRSRV